MTKKHKTELLKTKITEPDDMINTSTLSVLLFKMDTLNDIFKKCLPTAKNSEFQVHYRSATYLCTKGKATVLFTVPTVFYNFKQEVSSAYIDYHLTDMQVAADLVKPMSLHMIAGDDYSCIYHELDSVFDSVELLEIADNSFHRHPGNFGFSSTDYDKDPKEPGVIYRKASAEAIPQTDSVIYWSDYKERGKFVTTETRIVTVEPHLDGGVSGKYVEVPTITYIKDTAPEHDNLHQELWGEMTHSDTLKVDSDMVTDNYLLIKEIVDKIIDYINPNIDFIMPENITQRAYTYTRGGYGTTSANHTYLATDDDELDFAEQMGYDLSKPADKLEWEEWGKDYLEGYEYG